MDKTEAINTVVQLRRIAAALESIDGKLAQLLHRAPPSKPPES